MNPEWYTWKRTRDTFPDNKKGLKQHCQGIMDRIRRHHNRQIMKKYEQKSKICAESVDMGETVVVDQGLRVYIPFNDYEHEEE